MRSTDLRLSRACVGLGLLLAMTACGPTKEVRAAQERARLEQETKSRHEAEKANKAITEMNRKLGRNPPTLDMGLPVDEKKSAPSNPPKVNP